MLIAAYMLLKYLKSEKLHYILIAVICSSISVLIRNNYMIFCLAIIVMCIVHIINKRTTMPFIAIICMAFVILCSSGALKIYYENVKDVEIYSGEPKLLYIAMGLQEGTRAPGWYTGYNDEVYTQTNYDSEESAKIAKEEILSKIDNFVENPKYSVWFFYKKFVSTWCDSTFQSVWSGPIDDNGDFVKTNLLKNLYSSGKSFYIYVSVCNIAVVNILLFAAINSFCKFKRNIHYDDNCVNQLLPIIYLIGGILFHILWETKSQYVYTYIFFLIPLSANGLYEAQLLFETKKRHCRINKY